MKDLWGSSAPSNLPTGFEYRPDFLTVENHNSLFSSIQEAPFWRQEPVRIFGKWVMQPRLTAFMADSGVQYRYAGTSPERVDWTPELDRLRNDVSRAASECVGRAVHFNAVLLNGYRDGRDGMGWHRDNEPELGPEPVIASVSLGAVRRFSVRRADATQRWDWELEPGSLLLMYGRSQHDFVHAVPKTARPVGFRINLTFREIRTR